MDFTLEKYCEIVGAFKEGGWKGWGVDELCEVGMGEKEGRVVEEKEGKASHVRLGGDEGARQGRLGGDGGARQGRLGGEGWTRQGRFGGEGGRFVVLRHDVDLRPGMSLAVARREREIGMRASYYFRAVPESWDEGIIREIAAMGHEVGYHYESLTTCGGDVDKAWDDFRMNLERLRALVEVRTICMHGSPRSRYDSRDLWKKYDYRSLGIIGEPYLDTDWSRVFYLTDTGRRWDGYKVSVRDRIPVWQEEWVKRGLVFHGSDEVIEAIRYRLAEDRRVDGGVGREEKGVMMPEGVMMTTHPQRWYGSVGGWMKELVMQNGKNVVKRVIARGEGERGRVSHSRLTRGR